MQEFKSRISDYLPDLKQFSFLMTGDDDLAHEAVSEALRQARLTIDEQGRFPCTLSWLLFRLMDALKNQSSERRAPQVATSLWLSLLQIPPSDRSALLLVDGQKFSPSTAAQICDLDLDLFLQRYARAKGMFDHLARPFECQSNLQKVEAAREADAVGE